MDKLVDIINLLNVINNYKLCKEDLLNKLKKHVSENIVFCTDVDKNLLSMFANLSINDYLCFDTESCDDINNNNKVRVWSWSLSNTINDIVVYGHTIDDFIDLMKRVYTYKEFNFSKKSKTKNVNIRLWVHNLQWDFEFFKYWFIDNNYTYYSKILYDDNTVEDEILDCDSWNVVENNNQVYNGSINIKMPDIKFKKTKFKSFIKLKFYDSSKLVPDSIKKIGKDIIEIDDIFNKIGEEFDYDMIRPYDYQLTELEKCYIYNDVYILKEFIRQYYIKNNLVGFTASSIAFNNMLNYNFPDAKDKYNEFTKIYPEIKDAKVIKLVDMSYSGGYTFCNPSIKGNVVEKEGHSIDINSSYPGVMTYEKLPYGMPKFFKGKYIFDEKYDIALQKVHFDGFKRKNGSNIGFIKIGACENFIQDIREDGLKKNDYVATNFDENGMLKTCNYNLVLTTFELELLESVYDFYTYRKVGHTVMKGKKNLLKNIEYVEGIKFKSKIGDFKDFIADCVERKNKYNRDGNECGKTVAKRDMNSLYGKFGSGFTRTIMTYNLNDKGLFSYERKYINESDYDYTEKRKYYRAFASFVTSYGRCKLQSVIINVEKMYGSENFLYSDTDSCYLTLSVDEIKSLGVEIDKEKLGAWDLETEFTQFKCLGPKKYMLYGHKYLKETKDHIIPHCSGLPYDVQKTLNFDRFYLGAVFKKKQKEKRIGGYKIIDTEYTITEFTFY